MWLTNINIRVKQYPRGFAIEIQKRTWYGRKYWTHIEGVSGMDHLPWFFKTKESAIDTAVLHFKWDLMSSDKNFC